MQLKNAEHYSSIINQFSFVICHLQRHGFVDLWGKVFERADPGDLPRRSLGILESRAKGAINHQCGSAVPIAHEKSPQ
jgi:hypothetical protein